MNLVAAHYNGTTASVGIELTDRLQNPNNGYGFIGTSHQCLMTQAHVDASVTGAQPRAIAFWMKTGANPNTAIAMGIGGSGQPFAAGDHFGLYGGGPSGTTPWQEWFYGNDVPIAANYADNTAWQFWVISYSGAGATLAKAYLNGSSVATQNSWATLPNTAAAPLFVGCGADGTTGSTGQLTGYFTGAIDDIRVFNRWLCDGTNANGCLASTNEIGNLYNVSRP